MNDETASTLPPTLLMTLDVLAEREHEKWVASKVAQGWQPGTDVNQKQSPLLMAYQELPETVRSAKRSAIQSLLIEVGGLGFSFEPRASEASVAPEPEPAPEASLPDIAGPRSLPTADQPRFRRSPLDPPLPGDESVDIPQRPEIPPPPDASAPPDALPVSLSPEVPRRGYCGAEYRCVFYRSPCFCTQRQNLLLACMGWCGTAETLLHRQIAAESRQAR